MIINDHIYTCIHYFKPLSPFFLMFSQTLRKDSAVCAEKVSIYLCSSVCVYVYCWSCVPATVPEHIFPLQLGKPTHSVETQRGNFVPKLLKKVSVAGQVVVPHATCRKTTNWYLHFVFVCIKTNDANDVLYSVFSGVFILRQGNSLLPLA